MSSVQEILAGYDSLQAAQGLRRPAALGAAPACFLIRLAGIRYNINTPIAPGPRARSEHTGLPVPAAPNSTAVRVSKEYTARSFRQA